MNNEEQDYNEFEQWVNENMYDDSLTTTEEIIPSTLEKFRGDSTRNTKISVNKQSQLIIRLLMTILLIFMILVIILKTQYNPVTVIGPSMEPTLHNGDILRTTTSINANSIKYDTIICFKKDGSKLIIKRVIGLPGDTISFKNGRVIVNGKVRNDEFPLMNEYPSGSITLKEDEYYCLGDNRNNSIDSRVFGVVNISEISNIVRFNQTENNKKIDHAYEAYELFKTIKDNPELATSTDAISEKYNQEIATATDAISNKSNKMSNTNDSQNEDD